MDVFYKSMLKVIDDVLFYFGSTNTKLILFFTEEAKDKNSLDYVDKVK